MSATSSETQQLRNRKQKKKLTKPSGYLRRRSTHRFAEIKNVKEWEEVLERLAIQTTTGSSKQKNVEEDNEDPLDFEDEFGSARTSKAFTGEKVGKIDAQTVTLMKKVVMEWKKEKKLNITEELKSDLDTEVSSMGYGNQSSHDPQKMNIICSSLAKNVLAVGCKNGFMAIKSLEQKKIKDFDIQDGGQNEFDTICSIGMIEGGRIVVIGGIKENYQKKTEGEAKSNSFISFYLQSYTMMSGTKAGDYFKIGEFDLSEIKKQKIKTSEDNKGKDEAKKKEKEKKEEEEQVNLTLHKFAIGKSETSGYFMAIAYHKVNYSRVKVIRLKKKLVEIQSYGLGTKNGSKEILSLVEQIDDRSVGYSSIKAIAYGHFIKNNHMFAVGHEHEVLIFNKKLSNSGEGEEDSQSDQKFKIKQALSVNNSTSSFAIKINTKDTILLSAGRDNCIDIFSRNKVDLEFTLHQKLKSHEDFVRTVEFSFDNSMIISGSNDSKVKIWRRNMVNNEFQEYLTLEDHDDKVLSVNLSKDNSFAVSTGSDGKINYFRLDEKPKFEAEQFLETHNLDLIRQTNNNDENEEMKYLKIFSIDMMPQRDQDIVVASTGGRKVFDNNFYKVAIWCRGGFRPEREYTLMQEITDSPCSINVVKIRRYNKKAILFAASSDCKIRIYVNDNYKEMAKFIRTQVIEGVHTQKDHMIDVNRSGNIMISSSSDKVVVWHMNDGGNDIKFEEYERLNNNDSSSFTPYSICYSNITLTGSKLATEQKCEFAFVGTQESKIMIWRKYLEDEKFEYLGNPLTHSNGKIYSIDFESSSRRLVSGGSDRILRIWSYDEKQKNFLEVQNFEGFDDCISYVKFGDNGRLIFASCFSNVIRAYVKINSGDYYKFLFEFKSDQMFAVNVGASVIAHIHPRKRTRVKICRIKPSIGLMDSSLLYEAILQVFDSSHGNLNDKGLETLSNYLNLFRGKDEIFWKARVHSINILLLAICSMDNEVIGKCLETFGYSDYFFEKRFDPFLIALKQKNELVLDEFGKYFEENEEDDGLLNFNAKTFFSMLGCPSLIVQKYAVKKFIVPGRNFNIAIQNLYPLDPSEKYDIIPYHNFTRDSKFKEEKLDPKFEDQDDTSKAVYRTTSFKVDISIQSVFTSYMLQIMQTVDEDILMSDLRYILREMWRNNVILSWCYAICNWAATLLFFIVTVFTQKNFWLILLSSIFFFILILFELVVASKGLKRYFKQQDNIVDLLQYSMMPAIMAFNFYGLFDDKEKWYNFIVTVTMMVAAGRALTMLRVVDGVRYLVAMILQVFIDMQYFMYILIFSTIFLALIDLEVNKTCITEECIENNAELNFTSLMLAVDLMYNLGYGGWGDSAGYNFNQYFHFLINTIFMPLILFNLLIAIISKTFEDFDENKEVSDIKETISLLQDFNYFIQKIQGKSKPTMDNETEEDNRLSSNLDHPVVSEGTYYIHLVKDEEEEEVNIEDRLDKLEEKLKELHEASLSSLEKTKKEILDNVNEAGHHVRNHSEKTFDSLKRIMKGEPEMEMDEEEDKSVSRNVRKIFKSIKHVQQETKNMRVSFSDVLSKIWEKLAEIEYKVDEVNQSEEGSEEEGNEEEGSGVEEGESSEGDEEGSGEEESESADQD